MLKEGIDDAEQFYSRAHRLIVWTWIRESVLTWNQGEQHNIKVVGYVYQQEPLCLLKALVSPSGSLSLLALIMTYKSLCKMMKDHAEFCL